MRRSSWKLYPGVVIALSFVLPACGGSDGSVAPSSVEQVAADVAAEGEPESDPQPAEEVEAITVDEGFFSTEVRLPLSMFSDDPSVIPSEEELRAEFDDDGYDIDVSLEGDVAVLKMSSSTYDQLKLEMRQGVDQIIDEALQTEAEIYKSVEYSDDMREFTVEVDSAAFGQSMSFFGFGVMLGASFYQPFAGVDPDDRYVKITYIDATSGEVVDVYDTREQ